MSAEILFKSPCNFVMGAAAAEQLPETSLPEVAFAGRSNVGKSSLINALTGRKALARTSKTPGRTQQLNFFDLGGKLMLVDMPGYGFAQISKARQREWRELAETYLAGRSALRRVFVLIDARRGIMESDRDFLKLLNACAMPCTIVLTKADKLKNEELTQTAAAIEKELESYGAAHPSAIVTSAETGRGIIELQNAVAECA